MFLQYIVLLRPLAPLYWWQQNKIHKLATRRKCRFATGIALHFLKFKLVRLLRTRSVVSAQCLACLWVAHLLFCATGKCWDGSALFYHLLSVLAFTIVSKYKIEKYVKISYTKKSYFTPTKLLIVPAFTSTLNIQR